MRADSSASKIMGALFSQPVMSLDDAMTVSNTSNTQVYVAMTQLEEAGIVTEITGRKRDRVWAVSDLMAELDDLDARIRDAML